MSWLSLRCHACGRTFDVPAQIVGQKVLCPTCPTAFIAEPPPVPRAEPVYQQDTRPIFWPGRKRISRRRARGMLLAPAIGLIIFGGLVMILTVLGLVLFFIGMASISQPYPAMETGAYIWFALRMVFSAAVSFAWGYMVLTAGYEIQCLGSYRHSVIGAISAFVPWNLVIVLLDRLERGEWPPIGLWWPLAAMMIIGLPLGLWALALLMRPDVKRLFDAPASEV